MALRRLVDRSQAGHELAARLAFLRRRPGAIVLGLPRGGVAVAAALAQDLALPVDALVVRKITLPAYPELAVGAVGPQGVSVWNQEIIDAVQAPRRELNELARQARDEVARREKRYRQGRPLPDLQGKTVIIADDGVATGATFRAAMELARALGAATVIAAVGVAPRSALDWLQREANQAVVLLTPDPFSAVGIWYEHFEQLSDDEVLAALGETPAPSPAGVDG